MVLLLCIILLALARVSFTDLPCGLTVGRSDSASGLRTKAGDEEVPGSTDSNILEACRSSSAASDILLSIVKSVLKYLKHTVVALNTFAYANQTWQDAKACEIDIHGQPRTQVPHGKKRLNEFRIY